MWFISRCISVDSLNSCFQQPKNRMSYNFDSCKNEKDILARRNDDDDDWQVCAKKALYTHHHNQIRRRIPKRYSDIVSPSAKRIYISRKDSSKREKYIPQKRSSIYIPRRHSLKPFNETVYYFNSSKRKTREIKDYRNDQLRHRRPAVTSNELRRSFDRNFLLENRKQIRNHLFVARSHSFNIFTSSPKKPLEHKSSFHHMIPRVKLDFTKPNIFLDGPPKSSSNHKQEFIIRTIENKNNITEEPIIDYNDDDDDEKLDRTDLGLSSSAFIVPETTTNSNEEQNSIPLPPPLPDLNTEQKDVTFRCRTIADALSSDHKLILKDEKTNLSEPSEEPHYLQLSKELTLTKVSQTMSRSQSFSYLIPQTHDDNNNEQIQDGLLSSSSSRTTSTTVDNAYEHRSSSSKIYNDYKKRTSLTNPSISTKISNHHHHSMIVHPMHTNIGLRSSSINEKLPDMTLIKKQMNVCLINQLNQHLSTRFRKQQEESCYNKNKTNKNHQQSYDKPPELMSNTKPQINLYDEPNEVPSVTTNPICAPSIPPPPPPLPVGGFPPINRLSNNSQQQQQRMTVGNDRKKSDTRACSTGTSTISSNLSDSRILLELRENPLFARAKQDLEIDRESNHRQFHGSIADLNESISYLRLDNCSKTNLMKSNGETLNSKQLETIIMLPNELDTIIGKQIKSKNDINQIKSRSPMKSLNQKQCRQSELEMIFQKRAQRSEQNLT